mgnify:CR=1 FL=1
MTAIKIHELACTPFLDQANQTILQGQGFTLIDSTNRLKVGSNYLITIHKISSTPDEVIEVPSLPEEGLEQ